MTQRFAELDWTPTPIGDVSLRRRLDPVTGLEVYEVLLGDEYLMSSAFTHAEVELARLGLGRLDGADLAVAVGGLGLGHTAATVLAEDRVTELFVVEALEPVARWHAEGLVPLGAGLTADPRCRVVLGDFFALSHGPGFDPDRPGRRFDAVLVDIDHAPRHLLAPDGAELSGADFYSLAGTRTLAAHLRPGGVYGLWSNDPPDEAYLEVLRDVFADVAAEVVGFPNPLQGREATNTVYLATEPAH
ncbi:spermidine synthase [uncultured Friedmanniella sp.]|uniref:spermidine synthase n=1 Tax=uncultured Friedmanniella sp. TaxID=335381 RepID=UPI0035CC00F6